MSRCGLPHVMLGHSKEECESFRIFLSGWNRLQALRGHLSLQGLTRTPSPAPAPLKTQHTAPCRCSPQGPLLALLTGRSVPLHPSLPNLFPEETRYSSGDCMLSPRHSTWPSHPHVVGTQAALGRWVWVPQDLCAGDPAVPQCPAGRHPGRAVPASMPLTRPHTRSHLRPFPQVCAVSPCSPPFRGAGRGRSRSPTCPLVALPDPLGLQ